MADLGVVESPPVRQPKPLLPGLVVKNVFALYGVQVARKLIPLASMPYLARVLGPRGWGEVAFVNALAELIVILIEFGFNLSATRSIAQNRDDPSARGRIAVGVVGAQSLLAVVGVSLALVVSRFIPFLRQHPSLLAAGLVYALAQGFVPLWYFQGMERIRLAASLEVGAKVAGLLALFVFVKNPHDAWRALAVQALSPAVSLLGGFQLAARTCVLCRPDWRLVQSVLDDGWNMFMYRSAESLYGVANAFLLGLYVAPLLVGYFSSAEKICKATAGLLNPIRESLYPRISNLAHQDGTEAQRLAKVGAVLVVVGGLCLSAGLFLFAKPIVLVLLGEGFEPAVRVLRILSPLPMLLAATFSSGQFWLLPLHKDATVTRAVICAALLNISLSFILGRNWGHVGMAFTVLVSESVVAFSLLYALARLGRRPFGSGAHSCTI